MQLDTLHSAQALNTLITGSLIALDGIADKIFALSHRYNPGQLAKMSRTWIMILNDLFENAT